MGLQKTVPKLTPAPRLSNVVSEVFIAAPILLFLGDWRTRRRAVTAATGTADHTGWFSAVRLRAFGRDSSISRAIADLAVALFATTRANDALIGCRAQ